MSWIIQNLLSNRTRIRGKTFNQSLEGIYVPSADLVDMSDLEDTLGYTDPLIESDEFNDLLVVEKAIEELKDMNLLSQRDLKVLEREVGGYYNRKNGKRKTQSKEFSNLCERIAYFIGGYFTDEGYISYLVKKYRLSQEQATVIRVYMKSKYKNKILRKGFEIKNAKITDVSTQM